MHKKIALIGNPNVGKSTLFNELTNMHQHTGNWSGKTVGVAIGKHKNLTIYDLPGTYSLIPHSKEEEITSDFVIDNNYDIALIICDSTMLERNLNLVIQTLEVTDNVVLCLNMIDELKKKGISIDIDKLSSILGIPVVGKKKKKKIGTDKLIDVINNFKSNKTIKIEYEKEIEDSIKSIDSINRFDAVRKIINGDNKLVCNYLNDIGIIPVDSVMKSIYNKCSEITNSVVKKDKNYSYKRKLDKILTNKITGIPIMLLMLIGILYISIVGANYPSSILFNFFAWFKNIISNILVSIHIPSVIRDLLIRHL